MEIRFWVWVVSMSCGNIPFPCTFLENKPLLCLLAFSPAGWLRLVSQCCRCLGWPLLWGVCCTVPCWAAQFRGWASCKKHREKHCTGERLHWNPIKERGAAELKRQAKGEETFYLYVTSTNLASTSRGCILTASLPQQYLLICRAHEKIPLPRHSESALHFTTGFLCDRGCPLGQV